RIHLPERPVKIEPLYSRREVQPLRKHDLEDVPRSDIFLASLHTTQKALAARARMNLQFPPLTVAGLPPYRRTQSSRQLSFQGRNVPERPVIGPTRALAGYIR